MVETPGYADALSRMRQNYHLDESTHTGPDINKLNSSVGFESASYLQSPKIIEVSKLGYDLDRYDKTDPHKKDELKEDMIMKLKRKGVVQKRAQNKHLLAPSGRKEVVLCIF